MDIRILVFFVCVSITASFADLRSPHLRSRRNGLQEIYKPRIMDFNGIWRRKRESGSPSITEKTTTSTSTTNPSSLIPSDIGIESTTTKEPDPTTKPTANSNSTTTPTPEQSSTTSDTPKPSSTTKSSSTSTLTTEETSESDSTTPTPSTKSTTPQTSPTTKPTTPETDSTTPSPTTKPTTPETDSTTPSPTTKPTTPETDSTTPSPTIKPTTPETDSTTPSPTTEPTTPKTDSTTPSPTTEPTTPKTDSTTPSPTTEPTTPKTDSTTPSPTTKPTTPKTDSTTPSPTTKPTTPKTDSTTPSPTTKPTTPRTDSTTPSPTTKPTTPKTDSTTPSPTTEPITPKTSKPKSTKPAESMTTTKKPKDSEKSTDPKSTTASPSIGLRFGAPEDEDENVETPKLESETNPMPNQENPMNPGFQFFPFGPFFMPPYIPNYASYYPSTSFDPAANVVPPAANNYLWTGPNNGAGTATSFASAGAMAGASDNSNYNKPSFDYYNEYPDYPNTGIPAAFEPNTANMPNMVNTGGYGTYEGDTPAFDPSAFAFPDYNMQAFQQQLQENFKQLQDQFQKQQQSIFDATNRIASEGAAVPGAHTAYSSINLGPQGGYQSGAINPAAPGIASRFAEELPPPSGNTFGVFSSSSSHTQVDPSGKTISHKSSTTGVNDNGKITFRTVQD